MLWVIRIDRRGNRVVMKCDSRRSVTRLLTVPGRDDGPGAHSVAGAGAVVAHGPYWWIHARKPPQQNARACQVCDPRHPQTPSRVLRRLHLRRYGGRGPSWNLYGEACSCISRMGGSSSVGDSGEIREADASERGQAISMLALEGCGTLDPIRGLELLPPAES